MSAAQEALAAAYESWNAGDLNGYLSLYDEGIALHGYSPEPMGKTQVRGFYEAIFAAFGAPETPCAPGSGPPARPPVHAGTGHLIAPTSEET